MATILKRGSRAAPKFFIKYDVGVTEDGKRVQRMKLLRGVENVLQARQEAARVERAVGAGVDPFPVPAIVRGVARGLLEQWGKSLTNRNASNDRTMVTKHLMPPFGDLPIDQITLPVVMSWLDELAASDLSPQTQRHALGTLSRFFSWAIERGQAALNPVKMVPPSRRPTLAIDRDQPWLEDESKVPELVEALGADIGLMFYLANRSGLRLGECAVSASVTWSSSATA
jgi:hypothetical protein